MENVGVRVVQQAKATPAVARELDEQLKEFLLEPAFKAGVDVKPLDGVWEVPEQPTIYRMPDKGAWLFSNYKQDLMTLELGGVVAAPGEQIRRLHVLAEAGLACDVVAIAHELPPGWEPGQRLVPNPPKTREREVMQAFAKQIGKASRATARAAGAATQATAVAAGGLTVIVLGAAVGAVGAAAGTVPAVSAAPAIALSLDPIIYGGVEHAGRVRWVELARWYW